MHVAVFKTLLQLLGIRQHARPLSDDFGILSPYKDIWYCLECEIRSKPGLFRSSAA